MTDEHQTQATLIEELRTLRRRVAELESGADTTACKPTEAVLPKSTPHFQQIFDLSPQPVAITNLSGRLVDANPKFCRTSGYTKEELIGRTTTELEFYSSEKRAIFVQKLQSTGQVNGLEMTFYLKDRSPIYMLIYASFINIGAERLILTIFVDITERKRIEGFFKAILEQSDAGITVADTDGNYVLVNAAFCRLMGYSSDELLNMTIFDLLPEAVKPTLFQKIVNNENGRREVELLRKDNRRIMVEVSGQPLKISGTGYVLGFVRDIAARKQAAAALQESEERYRSLFKNNHSIMLLVDPQTADIVDANPVACAYYGYDRAALTALKITDINSLSGRKSMRKCNELNMSNGITFYFATV